MRFSKRCKKSNLLGLVSKLNQIFHFFSNPYQDSKKIKNSLKILRKITSFSLHRHFPVVAW
jgi:hypothetical protein